MHVYDRELNNRELNINIIYKYSYLRLILKLRYQDNHQKF